MIRRRRAAEVAALLDHVPAVVLVGARQVGKTTLALDIADSRPSVYIDLESDAGRARIADPELYLADHDQELVVLDEVHRMPGLFQALRGVIDQGRRSGARTGRFLLLGSASVELLKQSGETLAGRVGFVELEPLDVTEVAADVDPEVLWVRGGFPDSLLAADDQWSFRWRQDFIRTYLERDVSQFGPRIPAETLRRLWTMLAHQQGGLLNAAQLARNLGVAGPTVAGHLDLLVDLLLVRRLPPWQANTGKRLVKAPKVYVRDSGLVHALLGLANKEALLSHPVVGQSWEGHVIENVLRLVAPDVRAEHYRASGGAELDLVLTWPAGPTVGVEVKRAAAPRLERGVHSAVDDIGAEHVYVAYPGTERYPMRSGVEAIGVAALCEEIAQLQAGLS